MKAYKMTLMIIKFDPKDKSYNMRLVAKYF